MITDFRSPYRLVSDGQLKELRAREDELFVKRTPKSKEVYEKAKENLHNGVPMPWFNDWGTKHPVFLEMAKDSGMLDIDGNEYVDFCFGIPVAVYGFTHEVADKINSTYTVAESVSDPTGIGGTLSGNAFAIHVMLKTLKHVATKDAFEHMFAMQNRLSDGLEAILGKYKVPWSVTRAGARCELQFMPHLPRTGTEAKKYFDWELIYYTHLYLENRGIVITPFHNMMLMCPVTSKADVDRLIQGWGDCVQELAGLRDQKKGII